MDITSEFNPIAAKLDELKKGGQIEFYKRYSALDEQILKNIPYSYGDLENAFQHAYAAAHYTIERGENYTRQAGYAKETASELVEKFKNGKTNAFLDTNRDLWNNETGIRYALEGKKQGKTIKEIADDIFNNITKQNSDFIVNYKKDTRRWNNSSNEDNLWEIIRQKEIEYANNKIFNKIEETKSKFKLKGKQTGYAANVSNKKSSIKVDFNNVSVNGKKYKDWSAKEQKAFWDGFDSNNLNTNKDTKLKENIIKENKGKTGKIGIAGSSHWVTINHNHVLIED